MMAGKLLTGLLRPFRSDGFQTAGRRTEQLTLALHERLSLKLILARHGVVISRDGTPLLASCRKQIRKLPKILKSVKIIHYYSLFFIRVFTRDRPGLPAPPAGRGPGGSGGDERCDRLLRLLETSISPRLRGCLSDAVRRT